MAPDGLKRKRYPVHQPRPLKRQKKFEDLASLSRRIQDLGQDAVETFAELPLSEPTASGLDASHFRGLTDIQQKAIPFALKGLDVLGAAKTGSGKTLAFLIPVLENLYRKGWTDLDGLGALIISPTRELAIQIFEVLRKIGRYHTFSAGVVFGGKNLQEERKELNRMNILVCTPGRILQHMDQSAGLEINNLQMLVLDEADRILDMGFQDTVDAIVEHLPQERQTLLFSATQTKKVSDLARLSLRDPQYVSVHEAAASATPSTLQQDYIVTPLPEKLNRLWSLIRENLKSKIIVFLSSGKQVRFVYESFRHMQPGIPLLHLHGRQRQTARLDITTKFSTATHSCLFSTDVVARGLDFPAVDLVVQLDCPEDADTYIHRVGRTARYERKGRAVLFLEPSEEEGMLKRLEQKRVGLKKSKVPSPSHLQSITNQMQNMCFQNPELKYLGQKAFVSYVKSIYLQKDKEIFNLNELPLEEFSTSMGLPGAPKVKFLKGDDAKKLKNAPRQALSSDNEEDDKGSTAGNEDKRSKKPEMRTKYDRMFERRNQDILTDHYARIVDDGNEMLDIDGTADADGSHDFFSVKRRINNDNYSPRVIDSTDPNIAAAKLSRSTAKVVNGIGPLPIRIDSKRKAKLLKSKKQVAKLKPKGKKLVYDDEGNPHEIYEFDDEEKFKEQGAPDDQKQIFLNKEGERLREDDKQDKEAEKRRRKERKEKRRARERTELLGENNGQRVATLVPFQEEDSNRQHEESEAILNPTEETPAPLKVKFKKISKERPKNGSGEEQSLTYPPAGQVAAQRGNHLKAAIRAPETLEDLEAMATELLT